MDMKKDRDPRCLEFKKALYNDPRVLEGDWRDRRAKYKKDCGHFESTYHCDYIPFPSVYEENTLAWDIRFKLEGLDPRIISDHGSKRYLQNYSSLYDLSYNHFPKCLKGPLLQYYRSRMGNHAPQIDYASSYGNVTSWGLVEWKKEQWRCYKSRQLPKSETHDQFQGYDVKDFEKKRRAKPVTDSINFVPGNMDIMKLALRNRTQPELADPLKMTGKWVPPYCKPIDWECPPELEEKKFVPCIEDPNRTKRDKLPPPSQLRIPYHCLSKKRPNLLHNLK